MKKVVVVIVLVDMNESFNFWTLDNDIKMSKPPKFYLHHHISRVSLVVVKRVYDSSSCL